ncbi:pullulanase-specific type II secretion system outer membrane lipoprotein [Klebsiella michiganensis]|uniref:Pullulanase-specific type II secretion system outer membrane lipoprotein n=1 Tax=Klebsiella michiganensis TaxID=1134687 RepID=A0A7H4N7A7_9ENTR|nr:pullulanase-specific type II secretion system outer membrane lipoprotein [Klebsiella michiganensis]
MTADKYLLNCQPINFFRLIYYAQLYSIPAYGGRPCSPGCQQNRSTTLSPTVSGQAQLEQLASVAAGARYLKNKCNRSDLPADEAINRAAINVGKKRGWANIDDNLLSQRSAQLYQQLQQDSTPEATKCSQFNRQLAPFIDSLRGNK